MASTLSSPQKSTSIFKRSKLPITFISTFIVLFFTFKPTAIFRIYESIFWMLTFICFSLKTDLHPETTTFRFLTSRRFAGSILCFTYILFSDKFAMTKSRKTFMYILVDMATRMDDVLSSSF